VELRWWRPHQALSRAFEPQADAGWPPLLASPVSFRRATQTYKAVRRAIQHSQASLRGLAKRHGVNPKTVAKWKARSSVSDLPTGPKEPRSTVLSVEEEAVVVAFRRHTLLPLDDCLYALQPTVPHLTRSSLHRCLQRHGISRLPQVEGEASAKRKFKAYPIGYFHIDIAEVRTAQGKLYLLVAIDRTPKFAFVEMHQKVPRRTAGDFLRRISPPSPSLTRSTRSSPTTEPTSPPQAIRGQRRRTSRPRWRPGNRFGRSPSNTPAPRTCPSSMLGLSGFREE
jgi:hypothetical protein